MKPYPILYLPNMSDREKLIRALYPLGITVDEREDVDEGAERYKLRFKDRYPYMTLYLKESGWIIDGFSMMMTNHKTHTQVNSIRHFVEYARKLVGPVQEPELQEVEMVACAAESLTEAEKMELDELDRLHQIFEENP